jgi:transcriptional regulator with XRE-family HTH domain
MPPIPMVLPAGDRIKETRRQLGYTQLALSRKIGRTIATISNAECSKPSSLVVIRLIARILDTDPSEFIAGDAPRPESIQQPGVA